MRIILVATEPKGKNLVFVTDDLQAHTSGRAVTLVGMGKIEGVHVVQGKREKYLRSEPNAAVDDNLDTLSISLHRINQSVDDLSAVIPLPGFGEYWRYYSAYLQRLKEKGEDIISIDGKHRAPKKKVIGIIKRHRTLILDAAERFSIDPYILGAIVIDEIARANMWENITDIAAYIGWNSSAGVAQVKVKTARGLIRLGYYNPNPQDPKLSPKNINKVSRGHLYNYVKQSKHSVYFAAAAIREIIDRLSPIGDISNRPDVIGSLYSTGSSEIHVSKRGKQIGSEFYPLARQILQAK